MIITIMLQLAKITLLIVLDQMWSDLIYVRDVRTETSLPPTRRTGGRSLILNVIIAIKCRFKIILIIPCDLVMTSMADMKSPALVFPCFCCGRVRKIICASLKQVDECDDQNDLDDYGTRKENVMTTTLNIHEAVHWSWDACSASSSLPWCPPRWPSLCVKWLSSNLFSIIVIFYVDLALG